MVRVNLLPLELQSVASRVPSFLAKEWKRLRAKKWRHDHPAYMAKYYHDRYVRRWSVMSEEERRAVREKKAKKFREMRANWSPERRTLENSRNKKYREENHEKMCKMWSDWRKNNPQKHRDHVHRAYRRMKAKDSVAWNQRVQEKRHARRAEVIAFFGGKCVRCAEADASILHIDHIHGGAMAMRRQGLLNERSFAAWQMVRRDPGLARQELQLLCPCCNWVKRWESGEMNAEETVSEGALGHRAKRRELLTAMGDACVRCGFSDFRALHVHHKHNDGAAERKTVGNLSDVKRLRALAENRELFMARHELLCANCHEKETKKSREKSYVGTSGI